MSISNFVSVDWGTSRFRLAHVNLEDLTVISQIENEQGIKALNTQWEQSSRSREEFFLLFLSKQLRESGLPTSSSEPILISGMASSSIGIKELPYATLPFSCLGNGLFIEQLKHEKINVPLYLISGVRSDSDVIRGEETQLIGLYSSQTAGQKTLIILPGTHSKHVICDDEMVTDFTTFMTGEIFAVIRKHTILKNSLANGPLDDIAAQCFEQGVKEAAQGQFLSSLFKIRANDLLQNQSKSENQYYLSGLVLGLELVNITQQSMDRVWLAGSGHLADLYMKAASTLHLSIEQVSSKNVEEAVVRGQAQILKTLIH